LKSALHQLNIQSLSYKSRVRPILEMDKFFFENGKVYGLLGPSGVGKSTLLEALAGLESSQCISYLSWENQTEPRVSLMTQQPGYTLNPTRRVGKSLMDVYQANSANNFSYSSILKFCSLEIEDDLLKRYPFSCSGGELQRLVLAMSLFQTPDILLLDEPTAGIDHLTASDILLAIREWVQKQDISCMIASHDENLLSKFSDHIFQIKNHHISPLDREIKGFEKSKRKSHPGIRSERNKLPDLYQIMSGEFEFDKDNFNLSLAVNLSIRKHEVLGLTGKSGSGKSTIGKLIAQHLSWNSGDEIRNCERVQYLHQDPVNNFHPNKNLQSQLKPIFSKWSIMWNISFDEVLNLFEIESDWLFRNILGLSGGQRQRVLIARALLCKPEILIIDESFSGLDIDLKENLWNWLSVLREKWSFSILLISHDLEMISKVSDRFYVIEKGKVIDEINNFENWERKSMHTVTKSLFNAYYY